MSQLIPVQISRAQVVQCLATLGMDADEVLSFTASSNAITFEVYAYDADGMRLMNGYTPGTCHITVPIRDNRDMLHKHEAFGA